MSLVHRCDRCHVIADAFVDELPEDWRMMDRPVRGRQGARSTTPAAICGLCDDALVEWFREAPQ